MGAQVAPHPEEDDVFEVMRQNWDSLCAWLACETQWRAVAGSARIVFTGLDYGGVDVVLTRLEAARGVFEDLLLMEREALAVFAEHS